MRSQYRLGYGFPDHLGYGWYEPADMLYFPGYDKELRSHIPKRNNLLSPAYKERQVSSTGPFKFDEFKKEAQLYSSLIRGLPNEVELPYIEGTSYSLYWAILKSFHALKVWDEVRDKRAPYDWRYHLISSLEEGPAYAAHLKEKIEYGYRWFFDPQNPENQERATVEPMLSYHYYPCPRFLIWWEEEINDWHLMMEPLEDNPDTEEIWSLIEKEIRRMFKGHEDPSVPEHEILLNFSLSSSYLNGKKGKFYENRLRPGGLDFERHYVEAFRTPVQKAPTDHRDAITLDMRSYNTISQLTQECLNLLVRNEHSGFATSGSEMQDRIWGRLLENTSWRENEKGEKAHWSVPHPEKQYPILKETNRIWYYMRDFKKNGLTIPREIIIRTGRILKSMYPDSHFDNVEAWNLLKYHVDGKVLFPPRGTGLGMEAGFFTIFQIAWLTVLTKWVRSHWKVGTHFNVLCDDMILKFSGRISREEVSLIAQLDQLVMKALNCKVHPKKTYISRHGVYLENYTHCDFARKTGLVELSAGTAFAAGNIQHAKHIIHDIGGGLWYSPWADHILGRLVDYWGYEYYPTEYLYPIELGGWTQDHRMGLNNVLLKVNPDHQEGQIKAYHNFCKRREYLRIRKLYDPPTNTMENFSKVGWGFEFLGELNESSTDLERRAWGLLFSSKKQIRRQYDQMKKRRQEWHLILSNLPSEVPELPLDTARSFEYTILAQEKNLMIPKWAVRETTPLFTVDKGGKFNRRYLNPRKNIRNWIHLMINQGKISGEKPKNSIPESLSLNLTSRGGDNYPMDDVYIPIEPKDFDYGSFEHFCSEPLRAIKEFTTRTGEFPLRSIISGGRDPFRKDWGWYMENVSLLNAFGPLFSALHCVGGDKEEIKDFLVDLHGQITTEEPAKDNPIEKPRDTINLEMDSQGKKFTLAIQLAWEQMRKPKEDLTGHDVTCEAHLKPGWDWNFLPKEDCPSCVELVKAIHIAANSNLYATFEDRSELQNANEIIAIFASDCTSGSALEAREFLITGETPGESPEFEDGDFDLFGFG